MADGGKNLLMIAIAELFVGDGKTKDKRSKNGVTEIPYDGTLFPKLAKDWF